MGHGESQINIIAIVINVAIQILNLILFYWIFRKIFGASLYDAIVDRKKTISSIRNADADRAQIVADAESQSQKILSEAKDHKDKILAQAQVLATQTQEKIMTQAEDQAQNILKQAETRAKSVVEQVEQNMSDMVKDTATTIVQKLIGSDQNLQKEYLDNIISKDLGAKFPK